MIFVEKVPVVTSENLDAESSYPLFGLIEGKIIKRWRDRDGRQIVTINTEEPYGIETTNGINQFDIFESQLVE